LTWGVLLAFATAATAQGFTVFDAPTLPLPIPAASTPVGRSRGFSKKRVGATRMGR
jgi:hypothetical protein